MKFAHFSHVWGKPNMTAHERYEQLWRELELCDDLGFDYSFCVEHHFRPDESWMSSPALYAIAGGARTKRLRVGAMGFVVPLHHPLRLAEEIAIIDQMLGGRFECGLVPGISPGYFTPFGIDYNFRKSPTFEFVHYLRAAYGEKQPFAFHGDNHKTDSALLAVQPVQKPHPPLWMMSRDPPTLEFCAREGVNTGYFISFPRHEAGPRYQKFLAEWNAARDILARPTSATAPWFMSTRPIRRHSTPRCFAPAAPTKACCRSVRRARPSRTGSPSRWRASPRAASPAPARSCRTSSIRITSWRTSWCLSARRRP